MKKKQVLTKKVEASLAETEIFEDDVLEIEEGQDRGVLGGWSEGIPQRRPAGQGRGNG